MTPRICVSLLPKTTQEALCLIEKAEAQHADFIEVRLDCLKKPQELTDLAGHGKTLKIATIMPTSLKGKFSGTETERQHILLSAAKNGFAYVDLELSTPNLKEFVSKVKAAGAKPVVSFHDFHGSQSLSGLNDILEREISSGAEVCKIVTTAKQVEDNLTLLNFTSAASKNAKIVCFAMGEQGKISRLLSPVFGGFFTFASLERGSETAAGQMTIQEMRAAYELLRLK
ncbi:type I 3-dehydroquinate dehydratase [Candidatus Bathyarchaeota archaeon A05DMB-2]|nr:type I 3-dehydroquinate dehydratase [Candidatus Bathyarchaeota archaeon A05DMB-2]